MKKCLILLLILATVFLCASCESKQTYHHSTKNEETTEGSDELASGENLLLSKEEFITLYNTEKQWYTSALEGEIILLEKDLTTQKEALQKLSVNYQTNKKAIDMTYGGSGGAYQTKLEELNQRYKNSRNELSEKIETLEEQLSLLKRKKLNPKHEDILRLIADNNQIPYVELLRMYNQYMPAAQPKA